MIRRFGKIVPIALIVIFFLFFSKLVGLYVNWLFFTEVGYGQVFGTIFSAQAAAGLVSGIVAFLWLAANILLTLRVPLPSVDIMFLGQTRVSVDLRAFDRFFKPVGITGAVVIGLFSAVWGTSIWQHLLVAYHSVGTGLTDPVLGKDLGFYLFTLPLLEIANSYAGFLLFLTLVASAVSYALRGALMISRSGFTINGNAKKHLAVLGALFLLKIAFGFYLDTFELLYSSHTVIVGAGYTDVHAKLVILRLLAALTTISAFVFAGALLAGRLKLILSTIGIIVVISVVGLGIYPALLQNIRVAPNELVMEKPFIDHHIRLTRFGYDLQNVDVRPFDVSYTLTAKDLQKNQPTMNNVRLWDEKPLYKTFGQLQQIRTYYKFNNVDDDRYTINGQYRQVMLSARELSYGDLPSKSWINEKFVFTHGNGVAMSYVNRITREGLPEFIIRDIPPASSTDVKVALPEIYYGELTEDYVIANTKIPEFSYPTSEGNTYSSYKGSGGVNLDSFLKKVVFSSFFRTAKIVLSSDITGKSKILYNRDVTQRVQAIAPFLMLDSDPYIVLSKEGKLFWIIDAYTVSSRLPYSKPLKNRVNYMRNSVKAVVDAYNGSLSFYISDVKDPFIQVYSAIFPTMFRPLSAMPQDLREHIRFPKDLFKVQTSLYGTYHMDDAKVFYNKEDLWEVPVHGEKQMEPYYLIMKLPEQKNEEYVLLTPYTPSKRDNLAAWFAARCDGENYGKLVVYTFPRDRLVFGPRQIDARIDQDSYISQQLTLWGQRGSQVIRGRLLIIPVETSLLYIQPLYLAAEDKGGLPELRRVIVAYENEVVMEETLEQCLVRLFGGRRATQSPETPQPAPEKKASVTDLSKQAMGVFEKAKELQRQGDWAGYGEQLKKLEALLKQLSSR